MEAHFHSFGLASWLHCYLEFGILLKNYKLFWSLFSIKQLVHYWLLDSGLIYSGDWRVQIVLHRVRGYSTDEISCLYGNSVLPYLFYEIWTTIWGGCAGDGWHQQLTLQCFFKTLPLYYCWIWWPVYAKWTVACEHNCILSYLVKLAEFRKYIVN